jgi:hypothetical protein
LELVVVSRHLSFVSSSLHADEQWHRIANGLEKVIDDTSADGCNSLYNNNLSFLVWDFVHPDDSFSVD